MAKNRKPDDQPERDEAHDELEPIGELTGDDVVDLTEEGEATLQYSAQEETDNEAIDLGALGEPVAGQSGVSGVNWADLAAEPPPMTGDAASARVDAPSDADLRVAETLVPTEGTPHPTTLRSSSPPTMLRANEPEADLPDDVGGLDLSALHQEASEVVVPGAGSDPASSSIDMIEESLLKESKHDIQLPAEGESPSSRDLIAEAVESGIDLGSEEEQGEIDMSARPEESFSSAVDLGGPMATRRANLRDLEAAMEPEVGESEIDLAAFDGEENALGGHSGTAASEVDLGGRPRGGKESSSLRESGEAVSDSDENFSGGISSGRGISTMEPSPDSMVRVAEEPPPEEEIDLSQGEDLIGDEEDVKPGRKPVVPAGGDTPTGGRGGRGGWLGGTLVGTLLGAGACVGLGLADINLPTMAREAILGPSEQPRTPVVPADPRPVQPVPAVAAASPVKLVRQGDFDDAIQAGIEQVEETKPEQLALRGEFRWLSYLRQQRIAKAALKADDPQVAKAMEDLAKADTADATFWMGHIQEMTGNLEAARKTFTDAAEKYKADAAQRRRFEAALNRLDLRAAQAPAANGMSHRGWSPAEATLVALFLVAFQDQPPQPPAAPAQPPAAPAAPAQPPAAAPVADLEEAGASFWDAVKAARDQKFADALKAIDKARSLHDTNRYVRLRKAQNPLTDPTEEIFLRTCDELKAYYALQERLAKGGYLADRQEPGKAVAELIKSATEANDAAKKLVDAKVVDAPEDFAKGIDQLLLDRKTAADLADKLVKDKHIEKPEDLIKGVEQLAAAKKAADALADKLVKEKVVENPADAAKGVDALLAAKKAADAVAAKFVTEKIVDKPELDKAFAQVVADRKAAADREKDLNGKLAEADAFTKQIADELGKAKFLEKPEKAQVLPGLKKALELAALKDPQGTIRTLETQLGKANDRIKVSRAPEEMLNVWLPHMVYGAKAAADQSAIDANRALANVDAMPAVKAKAAALLALGAWAKGDFKAAQPALEKAQAAVNDAAWKSAIETALRDVKDPAAFFLKQADVAQKTGTPAAPLLARALETLPEAQRGPIHLRKAEQQLDAAFAQHPGKVPANDANLQGARKDAEAAAVAGLAEGHYLLGRIAEEAGDWAGAEKGYREAIKAHGKMDAEGSRYRIALAQLLLRDRVAARPAAPAFTPPAPKPDAPKPAPPAPKPEEKKEPATPPAPKPDAPKPVPPAPKPEEKKEPAKPEQKEARGPADLRSFLAFLTLAFQAAPVDPAQAEAIRLADEILALPEGAVPFDVRAKALATKGQYTRALSIYVEGLRSRLSREDANALRDLVQKHPALRRPESLAAPNGFEAERHYAAGLRHYFSHNYEDAEKALELAIANDNQDARFHYFLGLAKLAQNKREAFEDFEQGAKLELQERPGRVAVNAALERVQGRTRKALNEVRDLSR